MHLLPQLLEHSAIAFYRQAPTAFAPENLYSNKPLGLVGGYLLLIMLNFNHFSGAKSGIGIIPPITNNRKILRVSFFEVMDRNMDVS
jgi:hypothetical protein